MNKTDKMEMEKDKKEKDKKEKDKKLDTDTLINYYCARILTLEKELQRYSVGLPTYSEYSNEIKRLIENLQILSKAKEMS